MSDSRLGRRLLLLSAAVVVAAVAALPLFRALLWRWEANPILAGRRVAEEVGCPACHLTVGSTEIPNPGSRWGSVPRFGTGNAMMYVAGRGEIEELIRYGAPKTWLDDGVARGRLDSQHLRMPAYDDLLSDREVANLVAWAAAVEGVDLPGDDDAAAGRKLARAQGCTACHGVEGSGGLPNPGSLGGFIPGFLGKNFTDLVANEAEFQEWVQTGTSQRLAANPVVRRYWRRQKIVMPAYEDELSEAELGQLWRWVEAIRGAAVEP